MAAETKKINTRGEIGRQGEAPAADFLLQRGFVEVERNWRCRFGEIDLIMARNHVIHFVEVKTRRTNTFGYPEESVTAAKRQRWFHAMDLWLQAHSAVRAYQADVISVQWNATAPKIEWIENVSLS